MLKYHLSSTHFVLKGTDSLVQKIPGGVQLLGVPLRDYNPEFVFSLNICIRLDTAEEIFHRFSSSPNAKYQAMSFTMMTRLEYFTGGPAHYKVTTADDVASVGDALSNVIRDRIVPFFNEHKDAQALDRAVNQEERGIDVTLAPSGQMHSIILAYLAKNGDFDRLVAKHRSDMQLAPDVVHPFNHLVEYLRTNSERAA